MHNFSLDITVHQSSNIQSKAAGDLLFHKKTIICILQGKITEQSTHFLFTFFFKDFKTIRDKYDFYINHYLVDTISA